MRRLSVKKKCRRGAMVPLFGMLMLLLQPSLALASSEGLGVKLAPGLQLLTSVNVRSTYTDNFYYQPDSAKQRDTFGLLFEPTLHLLGDEGRYSYWVSSGVSAAGFSVDTSQDDYIDRFADAGLKWDLTAAQSISAHVSHKKDHDPFGTDRTELGNANPALTNLGLDKWTMNTGGVLYQLGSVGGTLGLELAYDVSNKDYDTNRHILLSPSVDVGTRFLDYDIQTASVTGLYHHSGKTTFVAEWLHSDIHIPHDFPGFPRREATQDDYRVGVIWKATGQTSGDARVGYVDRDFDDSGWSDFKKVNWLVGATWAPWARTQFRLESGRVAQETYLTGSGFIDDRFYRLKWTYDWTPRFQHTLGYEYATYDFTDSNRQDKVNIVFLSGDYMMSKYWKLQAGLRYEDRDSSATDRDYGRYYGYVGFKLER